MKSREIVCNGVIERTSPSQPRYVMIDGATVAPWQLSNTSAVEGTMNGMDLGRIWLKMGADDRWVIEVPAPLCAKAQVAVGDKISLRLRLASDEMPRELRELLDIDPLAAARWEELSESEQRRYRDHITAGRLSETRARRARERLT